MFSNKVDDPNLKNRIEALQNNKAAQSNKWLQDFLKSVLLQFSLKGYLTHAQVGILDKNEEIYDLSKLAQKEKEHNEWVAEYDERKKYLARKVAEYYEKQHNRNGSPFYYEKIARAVLEDENYIPSRYHYEKMVNNIHAKRYISAMEAEPKFQVGDYVELRTNSKGYYVDRKYWKEFSEMNKFLIATVIEIKPPEEAIKGGMIYCLLPLGGTKMIEVQERFLKNAKGV